MHECPIRISFAGAHRGDVGMPTHRHRTWELIYQREGFVNTQQGHEVVGMHPGMILVTPPGVPHCDFGAAGYELFYILLDMDSDPEWPRVTHDDPHQRIGRVCESIWLEWSGLSSRKEEMLELLAKELDLLMKRSRLEKDLSPAAYIAVQARRILDERYVNPPTVSELAREIGVSRSALHAFFLEQCGQTPQKYLQSLRLRHALGLLHHSEEKLEVIAAKCGYCSASHLSRHIKAATGSSPGTARSLPVPSLAVGDSDDLPCFLIDPHLGNSA